MKKTKERCKMFCSKCGHFICEYNKIKLELNLYKPVEPINPPLKLDKSVLPKICTTPEIPIKINFTPVPNILAERPIKPIYREPWDSRSTMFTPRPMFKPMGMGMPQWNMMPTPPGFLKC